MTSWQQFIETKESPELWVSNKEPGDFPPDSSKKWVALTGEGMLLAVLGISPDTAGTHIGKFIYQVPAPSRAEAIATAKALYASRTNSHTIHGAKHR